MAALLETRELLLVEDNASDAKLVTQMLARRPSEPYRVTHVSRLSAALEKLRALELDVVLLDLRLPDGEGVDAVTALREVAGRVPIVVITGTDDEQVAVSCIEAGAQDYLTKVEVDPRNLARALGYAIHRTREAQQRELRETVALHRALSSGPQTRPTDAPATGEPLSARSPELFGHLVEEYYALFEPYVVRDLPRFDAPRRHMERIVRALGDAAGGPRDLLDVHVSALDRAVAHGDRPHAGALVFEARLLALEMMGLLVDDYRTVRRHRPIGADH